MRLEEGLCLSEAYHLSQFAFQSFSHRLEGQRGVKNILLCQCIQLPETMRGGG